MTIASEKLVIADLNNRNLKVAASICENEDGQVQMLSYDSKGLISFISDCVDVIDVNERLDVRMIRPIAQIGKARFEK